MSPVLRLRHCAACGAHVNPDRTCACGQAHGTARRREYATTTWHRLRAAAIAHHPWCTDCGATSDLTGDHLRYPATSFADVVVRCRSCNSTAANYPRLDDERTGGRRV